MSYATHEDFLTAVRYGQEPRYVACSGQSRGSRRWSVRDHLVSWWRPSRTKGRTRLFASRETAQCMADWLNEAVNEPKT